MTCPNCALLQARAETAERDYARQERLLDEWEQVIASFNESQPKLMEEIAQLRQRAETAEAERRHRRACECQEPDPVMQADSKFYCYTCSFETGARPNLLEPEGQLTSLLAAVAQIAQEMREHGQMIERDELTPAGYGDLYEWADRLSSLGREQ